MRVRCSSCGYVKTLDKYPSCLTEMLKILIKVDKTSECCKSPDFWKVEEE